MAVTKKVKEFTKESNTFKENQTNSGAEDPNTQDGVYIRKH